MSRPPTIRVRRIVGRARKWCRSALTAARALMVRTDTTRWKNVARADPPWDKRNQIIASFIPAHSAVLDLGSGAQTLKGYLRTGCEYQPCDIIKSSPEVILCDFNASIYPCLARAYDYVVCSGVLEYMRDPYDFLKEIHQYGERVLLSYNLLEQDGSRFRRLAKGWVTHLREGELEHLFAANGLAWRTMHRQADGQIIYELSKAQA